MIYDSKRTKNVEGMALSKSPCPGNPGVKRAYREPFTDQLDSVEKGPGGGTPEDQDVKPLPRGLEPVVFLKTAGHAAPGRSADTRYRTEKEKSALSYSLPPSNEIPAPGNTFSAFH